MMRSKFKHFACALSTLLGMLAFVAGSLAAQNTTGTIRGSVTGTGGAPIAEAQISARNVNSGAIRNALSNDAGGYALVGLTPGTYEMTVRRIGSGPQKRSVVVQIGATQVQDFALADAGRSARDAGRCTAATGTETRTSEVATNVTQAQIEKLPTPSRNFLDLAALAPGVTVTEDRVNGSVQNRCGGRPGADRQSISSSTERASRTT